jgi:nitrogen fixation protein FixH
MSTREPSWPVRTWRWFRRPNVWIPACFFAMFAVVIAVNATMILVGMSSWRGLVTTDAYEKGVAYNKAIQAEAREDALGWTVDLAVDSPAPRTAEVTVALSKPDGSPLYADRVEVGFVRPTQAGYDSVHRLTALGGGRFGKTVELPLPGLWELRIAAQKGGDAVRVSRRITVTQ